jgi:hypothetical protein
MNHLVTLSFALLLVALVVALDGSLALRAIDRLAESEAHTDIQNVTVTNAPIRFWGDWANALACVARAEIRKTEAPERGRALCGFDQLIDLALVDVRFTTESGRWLALTKCPLCANSGHQPTYSITSGKIGKAMRKIEPRGWAGDTESSPECRSMISRQSASPNPIPWDFVVTNASKMFSPRFGSIPGPESSINRIILSSPWRPLLTCSTRYCFCPPALPQLRCGPD